jgi:hypothetical protein
LAKILTFLNKMRKFIFWHKTKMPVFTIIH